MEAIEEAAAKLIAGDLLPEKSKDRYIKHYNLFMKWKEEKGIDENEFCEDVMLVYFGELCAKYAASSVWCFYSMLRTALQQNHNVDIGYCKVKSLLKKHSIGHVPKQSNVFEGDEVNRFLNEAEDIDHLGIKIIAIFGIYGATRSCELTKVQVQDIVEKKDVYIVTIPDTKTNVIRKFTVEDLYANYLRKYISLRPSKMTTTRFFIRYVKGKCGNQPMGKNKFTGTPRFIAEFLKLPNPEKYTGHGFRRSSATLLVNGGADLLTLKAHGGWKSDSSAQRYIADSVNGKRKIGQIIAGQIDGGEKVKIKSTSKPSTKATSTVISETVESTIESNEATFTCSQSIIQISGSSVDFENVPPNFGPTSTVPNSIVPTNIVSTSIVPTGIIPTGIIPTGIIPTGIIPTGIAPGLTFHNCNVNVYLQK